MKPTIGRIVHYVLPGDSRRPGEVRPAIVVRTWPEDYGDGKPGETVQLQVFVDGTNDGYAAAPVWKTSVHHDEEGRAPGTWHWPPMAPPQTQPSAPSASEKTKGQIGYEAYAQHTGGKTFDGRDMPTWEQVCASGTKVAGAWEAAAHAIVKSCIGAPKGTKLLADAPVVEKADGVKECG